ncbi:helix-turn-helix domain-containing protein [Arthrobacter sp. APC 3897]|jgi:TetR/AcrR family transcriptional regulator, cholesterol catabolism regulator|uniref:TetR/AcrR family transcriptional regulator n=1 Tax=Arthrobacter sp. APC 3897 TaxID=3035204 RepID=UPI0025B30E25|nr:TetR/AcrR family transcriptional regulator [Arthrobacter sp. APC 3897]MDN3482655.1 helix-turn-helix domain-containing protein [Arthrobacter sp. APC 3897]
MVRQLTREAMDLPAYQMERRQRILDAAKNLLRSNDYESIQIRDVASEANVALGTLYRYFSSKEHLYATVVYDWSVPFGAADEAVPDSLGTIERVTRRLQQALSAFQRRPNFYQTILMLRTSSDPNVRDLMQQLVLLLEEPFRADFSTLSRDEAADITAMVWAVLMDMVGRLLAGVQTLEDANRVLARFVEMIGLRLDQVEAGRP